MRLTPYLTVNVASLIASRNGGVLPADAAMAMEVADSRFVPPVLDMEWWFDDTSLADLAGLDLRGA